MASIPRHGLIIFQFVHFIFPVSANALFCSLFNQQFRNKSTAKMILLSSWFWVWSSLTHLTGQLSKVEVNLKIRTKILKIKIFYYQWILFIYLLFIIVSKLFSWLIIYNFYLNFVDSKYMWNISHDEFWDHNTRNEAAGMIKIDKVYTNCVSTYKVRLFNSWFILHEFILKSLPSL